MMMMTDSDSPDTPTSLRPTRAISWSYSCDGKLNDTPTVARRSSRGCRRGCRCQFRRRGMRATSCYSCRYCAYKNWASAWKLFCGLAEWVAIFGQTLGVPPPMLLESPLNRITLSLTLSLTLTLTILIVWPKISTA